jgi:hypothetical protein
MSARRAAPLSLWRVGLLLMVAVGLSFAPQAVAGARAATVRSVQPVPDGLPSVFGVHNYLYAHADPVMGSDPSGHWTLNEAMLTVWNVGVQATIAYPRIATAARVGFAAINLFAFATSAEYRFALINAGPVGAAEVLVADAFSIASTGVRTVQFAAGYVQSARVYGRVSEIIESTAVSIQSKYPGALVGVRGSLGRGARFDKDTKALAPFNKESWDVDAFVVSDKLAGEIGGTERFRTASSLGAAQAQIQGELKELAGYRSDQPFTFRVFTTREWVEKYSKAPFKEIEP